jgi:hypothetical protein
MQSWQPTTSDYGPAGLRYASDATGTWSDLQIAPSFSPLYRVAVAVDASARAHLSFVDAVNHFPWYAQPSGAWQAERIATESAVGASLALDVGAQPHVAFGRSDGLRHAVRMAGVWSLEDVPGAMTSAEPALALDAWDDLHVVFADPASGTLCYATQASGPWTTVTIETANAGGWHFVADAVDGAGSVHASYYDGATRSLKYATNETGDWVTVTADGADGAGGRTAIATDAGGAAHMSYVDLARSRLKYATNASGSWESFDLDGAGLGPNGWGDTSIAIDADGRIHIVYFAEGSLKWATRP